MDHLKESDLGFHEEPKDLKGIKRARTTGQLRTWEIPRGSKFLEVFRTETGGLEFPGLYILLSKGGKVYVGEAKNLYVRLGQHNANPEDKCKDWETAYIITDGRPATLSDFNDTVVRHTLELYLINLLKANKYTLLSQGQDQQLTATQTQVSDSLHKELDFFLAKKNIITKLIEKGGLEEVFSDELHKILERKKKKIEKWGVKDATVDGESIFIRPGSKKPNGWQITSRGRKPGSFIDSLQKGVGSLLIPRDGIPLVPLREVQKVITDPNTYEQDTIDLWVIFKEEGVYLRYKEKTIDITMYRIR